MKAKDPNPEHSIATCRKLGFEDSGVLSQRDTYFHAAEGRLKLREEAGQEAQLIAYARPNETPWRESRYFLVDVGDADGIRAALADTVGVWVEVSKKRRLFRGEKLQVHLDEVSGLGSFIEFELFLSGRSDMDDGLLRLQNLRRAFAIADRDLVAGSYSDLIVEAFPPNQVN